MKTKVAFLFAATIPFPTLGPSLAADTTLSPALVLGSMLALLTARLPMVTKSQLAAFLMLLSFLLTTFGRHSPETYAMSLVALAIGILPFTASIRSDAMRRALVNGFVTGLVMTSALMVIEVAASVARVQAVLDTLDAMFPGGRRGHGLIFARPKAGFYEPSHLAIYLAYAYVLLDIIGNRIRKSGLLKLVCATLLVLSTSLSGIMLVSIYMAFSTLIRTRFLFQHRITARRALQLLVQSGVVAAVVLAIGFAVSDLLGSYIERLAMAAAALQSGSFAGSEGSRINSFAPVFVYWDEAGLGGVLFGTGYGAQSDWLVERFGSLGTLVSVGRGHIDNLFAAVVLSTGLFGAAFYLGFLYLPFRRIPTQKLIPVAIFVLAVHFAYGHLISYLNWALLCVLANGFVYAMADSTPPAGAPAPVPDHPFPIQHHTRYQS